MGNMHLAAVAFNAVTKRGKSTALSDRPRGHSAVIGYGNVVAMIALGNADIYLIPVCVLDAVGHALLGGGNGQFLGGGIARKIALDLNGYAELLCGLLHLLHRADGGDAVACQHTDGVLQGFELSLGVLAAADDVTNGQEAPPDGIVNIDL